MTTLAEWLRTQLQERQLTQQQAAVYIGISGATISDILNQAHLPRLEILFRLADFFQTPREYLVRLVASMPIDDSQPTDDHDYLVEELLDEFRKLPDDWKPEAINQLRLLVRLSTPPSATRTTLDPMSG